MSEKKTNILMLMGDQINSEFLMNDKVITPNIDKLLNRSVVFKNAYCNSPLCVPSRMSLMTGQLGRRINGFDNASSLPARIPTFAHGLRRAGYQTILAGKMHFIGPDQLHGFERRATTDIYTSLISWIPDWSKGTYLNHGTRVHRIANPGPQPMNMQIEYDEEVGYKTLEEIRRMYAEKDERPFFLCSSFTHPHDPFHVPKHIWDLYEDVDIELPEDDDPLGLYNTWIQKHHGCDEINLSPEQIRNNRRAYAGMITYLDSWFGTIIDELNRLGMMENTAVVVTSDHGDMLGQHNMWFKRTWYDGSSKVPLIFALPEGKARIEYRVASLVDLAPTFLDIAGLSKDSPLYEDMEGDSLHSMLLDENAPWKDSMISEYLGEGLLQPMVMSRKGKYKYVYVRDTEKFLFDMQNDPSETNNLVDEQDMQEIVEELHLLAVSDTDMDMLYERILKDQRINAEIKVALTSGEFTSWDYQPFTDASLIYARDGKGRHTQP